MEPRPILSESRRTDEVAKRTAAFHADTVRAVAEVVEREAVVVVGMAQNPHVRKVRAALSEANVPFRYLEYGSYLSEWRRRLAIKMWSGWPTFPQVFVRGVLIGGHKDTLAKLKDGSFKSMLEKANGAA